MMSTKETPVRRISQRRLAMYERYVEKLRLEDFEKLTQFCKLHLSFLMDMDSERFEELFVEKQSSKSKLGNLLSKRKSLGSAGDRSSMCDKTLTGQPEIDQSVSRLASFLNGSQNLCQEGIFRKTGNIGRQKELKERLQLNEPVDLGDGYYTAHDCASVLKSFVGDLSEPLLHEKLFNAHLHTLEINKEETRLKVVCLLLQMMSSSHYKLAKLIFTLLHKVTVFCPQNLMNADNLGAIFAPHMLCPKKLSSSDLQNMAGQMQSVISFIIYHTPQLFVVPELLALDAVNHTKKTNINMSSSEESILSLESLDSTDHSRLTRKHKLRRSSEDGSEPIDTVVTFAQRRPNHSDTTVTQDTEVELAKLYAHVQSMPDSSKKRKLMKQFSEANGYQSQVVSRKKHTRSRSFGESIKRRFSRRGRQKLLNVSTDQSNGADNSVVIENGGVVPVACVSLSTENQHNKPIIHRRRSLSPDLTVNITTLPGSPYPLHRTSMKHLREKPDGAESRTPPSVPSDRPSSRADIDRGSDRPSPEGGEQCDDNLDEAFHQPSTAAPVIRKPLMPTANLPQTPDNKHMTVKKIREHRNTPPGPKRAMAVFDSSIRV